jgi:hypothetical protein
MTIITPEYRKRRSETMQLTLRNMQATYVLYSDIKFYDRPFKTLREMQEIKGWKDERQPSRGSSIGGSPQCAGCGMPMKHPNGVCSRANKLNMCDSCRDNLAWPVCLECNQLCSEHADNYFHIDAIALGLCFTCYHWTGVFMGAEDPEKALASVRTEEGEHYQYYENDPISNSQHRGFGGAWWTIEYLGSGGKVLTNNLWSQGTMSEHWRRKYPPNAKAHAGRVGQTAMAVTSATSGESFTAGIEICQDGHLVDTRWYQLPQERNEELFKMQTDPKYLAGIIKSYGPVDWEAKRVKN